jgi:glycosyltransferase involved in cell wall biosynthesis
MLGQLRELGIRTIAHLHVLDRSPLGREVGHPALALAFEHAYDLLMPCSETLADWLHGMGVPREKLVVLPNAPPRPLAGALVAQHLARRAEREAGPLRVLFLGRLDRQKGIERLFELARLAQPLGFAWRIIGGEVIARPGSAGWAAEFAPLNITVEPPLHDDAALAEALAWADVLLLPSRWEGAPLTILEAQRLGCVPLATRLGAVHELVRHEEDGLLVADGPDGAVAAAMLGALRGLADDRARLRRLSLNAAARAAGRDWTRQAGPLLERLKSWFPVLAGG